MTHHTVKLKALGLSDIGSSRENNEDVWVSLPDIGFFAIADGMGGHNAGEVAAQETLDFLSSSAKKINTSDAMELIIEMRHMIESANRHVYEIGSKNPEYKGMGTTLCCLLWIKDIIIDGKRISGPKDLGIERKQLRKLIDLYKKGKIKKVLIKVGIPFVPSFLVAYLLTLFFGNLLMLIV